MSVYECLHQGFFYLDGGTGSILQELGLAPGELPELWNLTHREELTALSRSY